MNIKLSKSKHKNVCTKVQQKLLQSTAYASFAVFFQNGKLLHFLNNLISTFY